MVEKLKIYLETSAIGYLVEDGSEYSSDRKAMIDLWERIKNREFVVVISTLVLDELAAYKNEKRYKQIIEYLSQINYSVVGIGETDKRIAETIKIKKLLISDKNKNNRRHIGIAIENCCDIIVSMNFRHLVNVDTIRGVREIYNIEGYGSVDIVQPKSMVGGEDG